MRTLAAALPLTIFALALGCGSPCQDLADRVCNCQPAGTLRSNCKSSVKNQIGNGSQQPTSADQQFCQSKLATCPDTDKEPWLCPVLQTAAGKEACGLSFPLDTGSTSG